MPKPITPSLDYAKRELGATDKIRAALTVLRDKAAAKQWTFEVGYTTAMDFDTEQITGMKPPADWREKAQLKDTVEKPERAALGSCVATAGNSTGQTMVP